MQNQQPGVKEPRTKKKTSLQETTWLLLTSNHPENTLNQSQTPLNTSKNNLKTVSECFRTNSQTIEPSFSHLFLSRQGFPPRGIHRRGPPGDDHHRLLRRRWDDRPISSRLT